MTSFLSPKLKYSFRTEGFINRKDCERIRDILRKKGIFVSLHECQYMWRRYSGHLYWNKLPNNDKEIYRILVNED